MSWLRRIFGTPPRAALPLNAVVIPDDIAQALHSESAPLTSVVEAILRHHIDHVDQEMASRTDRIPFWLQRDRNNADLEDELRDRVTQRRASESEN